MFSQVIKLYGLSNEEILNKINELRLGGVKVYVKEKYLDAFVSITSENNEEFTSALASVTRTFADYIYAERDISLYERLFEAISARKVSLCLFEQATGGIITQNLLSFDGAEKYIKVSYVLPSIKQMIDHFDLNPFKFTVNHGITGETAFDIAKHMRARTPADIYIVLVSTLAEGNELYYNRGEVAYGAIGTQSGVNMLRVEKQGGTKRDFMNQIAKKVCFKLIKLLR